ncbi:MAG: hypothetical protein K0Q53_1999 [Massilibacillus sp.]|jgi:hypothetical protein|nr:hypothetical protein [Massilibacillus sp.]
MLDFEWLKIYRQDLEILSKEQPKNIDIKEIFVGNKLKYLTRLAQFFVTQEAITGEDFITTIPISSSDSYERVINEIAPCYNFVRGIYEFGEGNIPYEIQLEHLNNQTKNGVDRMIYEQSLNLIIKDLYVDRHSIAHGFTNRTVTYRVDTTKVNKLSLEQTNELTDVWNFLCSTFLQNYGYIDIRPSYWLCEENLIKNRAFRYLCTISENVYLFVDDPTQRVIGINIL